jgi:hypothetical protein
MKKFLVTILALVYLLSTVGATLRLDCCLENLVTSGLGADTHAVIKENKVCKEEHKQAQFGHEQKHNDTHIRVAKSFPPALTTPFSAFTLYAIASLSEAYPVNNAPPQQANLPLFILHCVHRI